MAGSTTNLGLTKPTYAESQDVTILNGNMELIDAEAGKVRGNFAGAYDASGSYAVGEYCIYNGVLYRCTTAISGGEAWNANHWTQVNVGDELGTLSEQIVTLDNKSMLSLSQGTDKGYVAFKNGFMIQWGLAIIPVGSDRVKVDFSASYNYHIPIITITPQENSNATDTTSNLRIWSPAYASFYIYNKAGNVTNHDIKVNWIAIGTFSNI